MELSVNLIYGILFWLVYSLGLPLLVFKSCSWCLERCGEERLQVIPLSPWRHYHQKLFQASHQLLLSMTKMFEPQTIYQGLNPERCTQQAMKTLLPYMDSFTDLLVRPHAPVIWDNLPKRLKAPIYNRVKHRFGPCIDQMFQVALPQGFEQSFDHPAFIQEQLAKYEDGYRFLITNTLHNHWHRLQKKSQFWSLLLCAMAGLLTLVHPSFWAVFLIAPFALILYMVNKPLAFDQKTLQQINLSISHWLGEKIYLVDQVTQHLTNQIPTRERLKQDILKSFRPLTEDIPLKTLTQMCLGGQATLTIRLSLVNYLLSNSSIPFEHSQFRQERAQELQKVLLKSFQGLTQSEIYFIFKPMLSFCGRLYSLTALGVALNCAGLYVLYRLYELIA